MKVRLTRRQALKWGLAGSATMLLPPTLLGCGDDDGGLPAPTPTPTPIASFLTEDERATLTAVTGRIVPSDEEPGAIEAGAAQYIDRMLSILPSENDPGSVFAGGPFSGRNPFPDSKTGTPSTEFPPDQFAHFIPLTRLQLLSWRVRLLGTAAVPGSDFNGPVIGLRESYRTGLHAIEAASAGQFAVVFVALTASQQDAVLSAADPTFIDLVTNHTIEGMFCAPEYGGNRNLIGWQLIGYDGDSQPLGYSIFNTTTMQYEERPDKPVSTPDPTDDFSGVSASTAVFLRRLVRIVSLVSGEPYFPS